jgi:A/G-specific adenine glycosylase
MSANAFTDRLLAWYDRHGRKDLPWHRERSAYGTWISEIMLQQTQVSTVIPYFHRFMERFPDIASLAAATVDEVLHCWTGLGYYARARNLHKTARLVVERHGGRFPRDYETVQALPGIGASTAGAILAFAFDQRHVILDGNVKRVLARYHAVDGWPGKRDVATRLWALADGHTPRTRVRAYAQAVMDLGAIVCRRTRPDCAHCPVRRGCRARALGAPQRYPATRPRRSMPTRTTFMIMIQDGGGRVLLQRRPPAGLWGGLWGFPDCAADDIGTWCQQALGLRLELVTPWPPLRHTFSHFHLQITPVAARVADSSQVMENPGMVWYNPNQPDERGFAAPVRRLLQQLRELT